MHTNTNREEWDRRAVVAMGLRGLALASLPPCILLEPARSFAMPAEGEEQRSEGPFAALAALKTGKQQ